MTIDNLEYDKFELELWDVKLNAVEGASPATAFISWNIEDLERKKFTPSWELRIITSF